MLELISIIEGLPLTPSLGRWINEVEQVPTLIATIEVE